MGKFEKSSITLFVNKYIQYGETIKSCRSVHVRKTNNKILLNGGFSLMVTDKRIVFLKSKFFQEFLYSIQFNDLDAVYYDKEVCAFGIFLRTNSDEIIVDFGTADNFSMDAYKEIEELRLLHNSEEKFGSPAERSEENATTSHLDQLACLRDSGYITKEEFTARRQSLLDNIGASGSPASSETPTSPAPHLVPSASNGYLRPRPDLQGRKPRVWLVSP